MKQAEWIKALPKSIFVKLQLLFVGTGLLMTLLVVGMIQHSAQVHDQNWLTRNHNRIYYASILAEQIGNPPDLLKAQDLVSKLGAHLRVEGPGVNFTSGADVPGEKTISASARQCLWNHEAKVGVFQGRIYTMISHGGMNYILSYESDNFLSEHPEWGPLLLALVLFALLLNYLAIRWLFKPIDWISEGVQQFKTGHLAAPIKTRENDELGELAKSFNQMTKQVTGILNSKEQLLLDVSHELRSPITRIKVALELDDRDIKDQIKKNIRELEVMISELLESARLDTAQGHLRLSPVSVRSIIYEVVAQFNGVKPGIEVSEIPENLFIEIDTLRVEMVLKNVLENALKYSSHQSESVQLKVFTENDSVLIQIKDYGFGIPPDEQLLIFEPFYRVDKSRVRETGGYGLGLSLCKKIMQAHHGSIRVASSSERGTLFELQFKSLAHIGKTPDFQPQISL